MLFIVSGCLAKYGFEACDITYKIRCVPYEYCHSLFCFTDLRTVSSLLLYFATKLHISKFFLITYMFEDIHKLYKI